MSFLDDHQAQKYALSIRGRVGDEVIQGCLPGLGNALYDPNRSTLVRRHVIPTDPQTPAQLARRALHAEATAWWKSFAPGIPPYWNDLAEGKARTGYNGFVSHYLRAGGETLGVLWDGGSSRWDKGASVWDAVRGILWDGGASIWDDGVSIWDVI